MLEVLNHPLITHKLTQMRKKETGTKDFRENLDWHKWVCVMPTDALIAQKEDMILCLLGMEEMYALTAAGIESSGWVILERLQNHEV